MTFVDFKRGAQRYRETHPTQRIGQAWFNYLRQVRPDLADMVRGGVRDPFRDDRRVADFLMFVEEWLPINPPEVGP